MSQPPAPGPRRIPEAAEDRRGAQRSDADLDAEVAAFIVELRELRVSAGAPSYARLARTTGLPRSTLHDGLRGNRLPSLEVTLGIVRACGGDERQWRERWTLLRHRLDGPPAESGDGAFAESGGPPAEPGTATAPGGPRRRPRRGLLITAVAVLVAAGAGAGVMSVIDHGGNDNCDSARLYRADQSGAVLDADGHPVGQVEPGDTVRVRTLLHDRYAHRYYGTVQRTNTTGYLDEAKLTFVGQVCS